MYRVADAFGILWNKDVVYAEEGPYWNEGGSNTFAGLAESVYPVFCKGVVGI